MSIYVTGDTHRNEDILNVNQWYQKHRKDIDKNTILIQLGDWGAIWYEEGSIQYEKDKVLQTKWAKKDFTLLVVPGNHENYNLINKLPVVNKFGGKVRELKPYNPYSSNKKYKSIYLLERGEIYEIQDKTFLALGGAESIDKSMRVENISWWRDELWSKQEEDNCLNNLNKHNWSVDYVVSHTCPTSIVKKIVKNYNNNYADPTSKFFQFLLDNGLKFKEWHFGHWHTDIQIDDRFYCHFNAIPKKII